MQEISQNVPQFDDLIQDPKIPVLQTYSLCIQKRANNKYSKCGFLKKMKSFRKRKCAHFLLKIREWVFKAYFHLFKILLRGYFKGPQIQNLKF
jgi:hypothetical protein